MWHGTCTLKSRILSLQEITAVTGKYSTEDYSRKEYVTAMKLLGVEKSGLSVDKQGEKMLKIKSS